MTEGEKLAVLAAMTVELKPPSVWPWWIDQLARRYPPTAIAEARTPVAHFGTGEAVSVATSEILRQIAERSPSLHRQDEYVPFGRSGARHRKRRRGGHQ